MVFVLLHCSCYNLKRIRVGGRIFYRIFCKVLFVPFVFFVFGSVVKQHVLVHSINKLYFSYSKAKMSNLPTDLEDEPIIGGTGGVVIFSIITILLK
jgi:uncharacterized membrane protein YsdA (DUF1294 family)